MMMVSQKAFHWNNCYSATRAEPMIQMLFCPWSGARMGEFEDRIDVCAA